METPDNLLENALKLIPGKIEILVPKKLPKALEHVDSKLLAAIHPDPATEKEFALYFMSFISKTLFRGRDKKVRLNALKLVKLLAPVMYTKVITACLAGTAEKGPFIERDDDFSPRKSKEFNFAPAYAKCGLKRYRLKTKLVQDAIIRNLQRKVETVKNHPIVKNLLAVYPRVQLPNKKTLLMDGLAKAQDPKFKTKTGKKLVYRNRNPHSRFKKRCLRERIAFVEDHIEMFLRLTVPCWMCPSLQGLNAGNRITDIFTLMPSWIRAHVMIDGETLVECDFKCLHPNIIVTLFNGKQKFLTHAMVAERLGIDEEDLPRFKKEHLAFFNKHPNDMDKDELLVEYYTNHEPEMLKAIRRDKKRFGYRHTAKVMFTKEVEIMTACIEKLNALGIYVLYVYDALLCEKKHMDTVVQIMNETVLEHGVFTVADAKTLEPCKLLPPAVTDPAPSTDNGANERGHNASGDHKPSRDGGGDWQEAA